MGNELNDVENKPNYQIIQTEPSKPISNELKKCPYCEYKYLYTNQREINYYNKHVNSCNKKGFKNNAISIQQNLNKNNIPINIPKSNYNRQNSNQIYKKDYNKFNANNKNINENENIIFNNFRKKLKNVNKNFNNNNINNNFNNNNIKKNFININNNNFKNNNINNNFNNNFININKNQNNNNNNNELNIPKKNPKMIGSLLITDSLNEFLNDGKVELPRGKKDGTFEEKVDYLRYDISQTKVDFTEGCETLFISRENVFENSLIQIETFNIHKEI